MSSDRKPEPGQGQKQEQQVSVTQVEQGYVAEVPCLFYEQGSRREKSDRPYDAYWTYPVKVVVFQGRTVQAYCPYERAGRCVSKWNNIDTKPCYLLSKRDG
jgi:hypothetical protein